MSPKILRRKRDGYATHETVTAQGPMGGRSATVASATLVTRAQLARIANSAEWQSQAWGYYDTSEILRFGSTWIGNACSRSRLFVGRIDEDGSADPVPVDETDDAAAPLVELFAGGVSAGEMLRRWATHLTIPGESYLIGLDDVEGNRRWLVCSSDELVKSGSKISVRLPESDALLPLDPVNSAVIRLWRPHPRRAWWADSPVRALLNVLGQLAGLDSHVVATAESRLSGAGILLVAESATAITPKATPPEVGPPAVASKANPADGFMIDLVDTIMTAISDRDSAAAVTPIVMRVPDGVVKDGLKHLSFATPFDGHLSELREAAIGRIAIGLDMPVEVILGKSQANHWSAWQISDESIVLHIEPLLGLICDALTTQYLHPALQTLGITDPDRYVIWYDTSELTLRPNRAPEAFQAYELGAIGEAALLREIGFATEDAPDDTERTRILATRLALTNSALAPALLPLLGITLPPQPTTTTAPTTTRPALPAAPTGLRNEIPTPATAALQQAAGMWVSGVEVGVIRALERVGNWLLSRAGRGHYATQQQMARHEIHTRLPAPEGADLDAALAGAYSLLQVSMGDRPCVLDTVDGYVRALIAAREPHQRHYLVAALHRAGCLPAGAP